MANEYRVAVKCPYCGVEQLVMIKEGWRPRVVNCDTTDVPGCDRYYAVRVSVEPVITTFKIEEA